MEEKQQFLCKRGLWMTHSFRPTLIHITCKGGEGEENDKFEIHDVQVLVHFHVTSFQLDNKSLREVIACQIAQG